MASGRREFDDSAVEAAVAVAASLPLLISLLSLLILLLPSLLFHSFTRRRPKISPAGPLTRSRDLPVRSADRFHLAARRDSRLPMAIQRTAPLFPRFLAHSVDGHVSAISYLPEDNLRLDYVYVNTGTPRPRRSRTEHTYSHSRRESRWYSLERREEYNSFFFSLVICNFFFIVMDIRMWPGRLLSSIYPPSDGHSSLRFSHP